MRLEPDLGMRARTAPVSTVTAAAVSAQVILAAGADAAPGARENGPARPEVAAMAWPLHLTEPSGQRAKAQDCMCTETPLAAVRTRVSVGWTAPLGHGTPQLTPSGAAGGVSSSQCKVTGVAARAGGERAEPRKRARKGSFMGEEITERFRVSPVILRADSGWREGQEAGFAQENNATSLD